MTSKFSMPLTELPWQRVFELRVEERGEGGGGGNPSSRVVGLYESRVYVQYGGYPLDISPACTGSA